jgi:hypothetical protein
MNTDRTTTWIHSYTSTPQSPTILLYILYYTPKLFFLSSLLSPDPFVLMVFHLFLLFPYSRRVRPAERGGELCFPRFLTFHSLFLPIEKYIHTHTNINDGLECKTRWMIWFFLVCVCGQSRVKLPKYIKNLRWIDARPSFWLCPNDNKKRERKRERTEMFVGCFRAARLTSINM